jgi:hypothetical protein
MLSKRKRFARWHWTPRTIIRAIGSLKLISKIPNTFVILRGVIKLIFEMIIDNLFAHILDILIGRHASGLIVNIQISKIVDSVTGLVSSQRQYVFNRVVI